MKTILLLIVTCISLNTFAQEKKPKSQFKRGDIMIFTDSLKGELLGEFPSKWDLNFGSVEVAEFDGEMVISYTSKADIKPLMSAETYQGFYIGFRGIGNYHFPIKFCNLNRSEIKIPF